MLCVCSPFFLLNGRASSRRAIGGIKTPSSHSHGMARSATATCTVTHTHTHLPLKLCRHIDNDDDEVDGGGNLLMVANRITVPAASIDSFG